MIETAKDYWNFRLKYATLLPNTKKMVLAGEALLLLRDHKSPSVRRRLQAFITSECLKLGVADKTAAFTA